MMGKSLKSSPLLPTQQDTWVHLNCRSTCHVWWGKSCGLPPLAKHLFSLERRPNYPLRVALWSAAKWRPHRQQWLEQARACLHLYIICLLYNCSLWELKFSISWQAHINLQLNGGCGTWDYLVFFFTLQLTTRLNKVAPNLL